MRAILFISILLLGLAGNAQQLSDGDYIPVIANPAYRTGKGPRIAIDEGHYNFHTINGRYRSFAQVLQLDGYRLGAYKGEFTLKKLESIDILVISNALNEANVQNWYLPTPSAFSDAEIAILKEWVEKGGSLFLIADHMPMAGAALELARAFGFGFTNGFAIDTTGRGSTVFSKPEQTLLECVVTEGRDLTEQVGKVVSFTGQAFMVPPDAIPVLKFPAHYTNFLPDTAWVFSKTTEVVAVMDHYQGAILSFGMGKIAVFGEAAMFTAQVAGPQQVKIGMNSPEASENYKFLLNIIHWLDGILE